MGGVGNRQEGHVQQGVEAPGGEGGRRPEAKKTLPNEISKKITNLWEGKEGRDQGGHVGGGLKVREGGREERPRVADYAWGAGVDQSDRLIGEVEDFMGDWAE